MATTKKAQRIAQALVDVWAKEVASTLPIITQSVDTLGNPVITLSADATPATGEKVVVVLVKPIVPGTVYDVFGNSGTSYGPHMIQFCTELNYAATTDNVADILTPVELLPVICEIGKQGAMVEWHQTANGTVPSSTAIAAGTALKASWGPLYFGTQASQ